MKPIFFGYMITILVLSACSSGKTTFERGNYYEAVMTSVNRLRRNSDHKKSVEILRQAYPFAVNFYVDRANTSLASGNAFKWNEVVNSYTAINTMYDEIRRCPGALKVIPEPVNYFSQLQQARQHAAEENYTAGITALQFGNREKAKEAYAFFKTALGYVPDYKDATKYMEEALWAATVKVMVESIPVHSKTVGVSAEFFNDKISEFVHSAPINEFVRFFTRQEIEKAKLKPDHIIQLAFDDFTVGQVYRREKESQLTKDSVEVGSYVTASASNPQNDYARETNPAGGKGFVASQGSGVVVPKTPANTRPGTVNSDEQKALADKLKAEQELAGQQKAAKEEADQALADKLKADKEKADKEIADKLKADKERTDKEIADKLKADKEKADKELADKLKADKELADKLKADKEKADKLKADKEKADKELADKLKAYKEKYTDPTIDPADTTNVKDPVTVCHMPPGNKANSRTLKISRSALKAHLGHGDVEGSCETDNKAPQGKPQENNLKDKTPAGSDKKKNGQTLLYNKDQVFIASNDNDIQKYLSYFSSTLPVAQSDTNKVYATVKATLYEYQKTITSKGIISFKIIDAKTGALLSVEKMPGEFVWVSQWATFNGDERALSGEQLKLTRQKEQVPPGPQDLFIEFTKPIYHQLTSKIQDFYKGY